MGEMVEASGTVGIGRGCCEVRVGRESLEETVRK